MKVPSICIAGIHSDCGKSTVSLGIMSALIKRGLTVQPFKVGPDFIDPGHHRRITGRDSHNLDGWMLSRQYNNEIFSRYSQDADVAVVEGVMGLFDGFSGSNESGSTAQMAKWLDIPVIIVIDARAMARSAAAVALGFSRFDPDLHIAGFIFNRVGSNEHRKIVGEALALLPDLSVIGYLPRDDKLKIPSRHLGLITDEDFGIDEGFMEKLARWMEDNIDLETLLRFFEREGQDMVAPGPCTKPGVRIGIARDEAFCFYYPENFRLLREAGAELIPFSPLRSKRLPKALKGLYFGGGYPELHCRTLAENHTMLEEIREFGLSGRPIYGECGGFMFLMKEIHDLEGIAYPMVGLFPVAAQMEDRLKTLGYREIATMGESILGPACTVIRGHEFHYSRIVDTGNMPARTYSIAGRYSSSHVEEGFIRHRVLGSYVHLHWGSNSDVAGHFVEYCSVYG
ncbi:MAG: cobyrinate a,c-diamide synthase [Desulfobacteraceae bacterium]|nr:cobyrinate a,c-diamide synthase [Desulfobacteraceae bacterium]